MLLYGWKERGAGGINAMLEMADNNTKSHISEFPIGTYKKAHRHGPGAHLVLLSGTGGYSLIWTKEDRSDMIKCDWALGSMVTVPSDNCYHQHFNSGTTRARYLALRPGDMGLYKKGRGGGGENADRSLKEGGWQIEYEDEEREIHADLRKRTQGSRRDLQDESVYSLVHRRGRADQRAGYLTIYFIAFGELSDSMRLAPRTIRIASLRRFPANSNLQEDSNGPKQVSRLVLYRSPMMRKNTQTGGVVVVMLIVLVVLAAVVTGYIWVLLNWNYSVGERAGWVQKISKKGWFCKTWEGELLMVSMPGTTPEKFLFSVRDDSIAESINKLIGQRVSLHYEEKVGLPTTCFGETRHFITKVTVVDQTQQLPAT